MAHWGQAHGREILALTVDHGLQAASAAWTAEAGRAAAALGVGWRALTWVGAKPVSGLPAAARRARHALLAEATREIGGCVLLLGHTADDVAESELIRAETPGHGRLRPWTPSPVWPEGRGVFVLRPLLALSRADLRRDLLAAGLSWIEDPANADPRFARTRARSRLVGAERLDPPVEVSAVSALKGSGRVEADVFGAVRLPRDPPPSQVLLARAIACASGRERPPPVGAVARLAARLAESVAGPWTLGGARVVLERDRLAICREPGRAPPEPLRLDRGRPQMFDGRSEITADLADLRVTRLVGHAARLPREDRRRLATVPAFARPALPVLLCADGSARLPRPFGDGPALAVSRVGWRLAASIGQIDTEGALVQALQGGAPHGAGAPPILSSAGADAGEPFAV